MRGKECIVSGVKQSEDNANLKEIADLLGVFSCDIRKVIHAIYKRAFLIHLNPLIFPILTPSLFIPLHYPDNLKDLLFSSVMRQVAAGTYPISCRSRWINRIHCSVGGSGRYSKSV